MSTFDQTKSDVGPTQSDTINVYFEGREWSVDVDVQEEGPGALLVEVRGVLCAKDGEWVGDRMPDDEDGFVQALIREWLAARV